jgi:Flp pilus assembly pilin Flp
MRSNYRSKLKRQEGQGMVEYIILVVFIAVVAIAVVTLFGTQIRNWFGTATGQLSQDPAGITNVTGADAKTAAEQQVKDLK